MFWHADNNKLGIFFAAAVLSFSATAVSAEPAGIFGVPTELNDKNTSVHFAVDTTWHMVHGKTSGVHGSISFADPSDLRSLHGEVRVPVKFFDTDNSSRDSRLQEVMGAADFPEVSLEILGAENICRFSELQVGGSCRGEVLGILFIRGVRKDVRLPFEISRRESGADISGKIDVDWQDFGVQDPSIFVARVHKTVSIEYAVALLESSGQL